MSLAATLSRDPVALTDRWTDDALGAWWVALGLVPQLFFWIWLTIAFGGLFGIVAAAIARRRGTAAA